ncbi:MAG TPA: FecR domain-containing protein [Burkholderiaceae bacterium]
MKTISSTDSAADEPDALVLRQAAEWFATLSDEHASARDWQQWQKWLAASPAHQAAWKRVETISGKLAQLPLQDKRGARQVLENVAARKMQRRKSLRILALFCTTGLVGTWAVTRAVPWQATLASHRTHTGEQKAFVLDDGSSLWLNTASSVDVQYTETLRRLHLLAGEILVQTGADPMLPARPFVVDTRHGRMRALGTRFNVRQWDDFTDVAVFDGAVHVQPGASSATPSVIQSGQQARFTIHGIQTVETASLARQAWRDGLLLAEDMRLEEFIAELARHRRGHLGCAPDVANLRIVGTYKLDDTDAVLALLEDTLPVRIRRTLPWWVDVTGR